MATQSLVPLKSDFSNKPAFINSLFNESVRDPDQSGLYEGIRNGELYFSYADTDSKCLILNSWLAAWQAGQGDSYDRESLRRCPSNDRQIIHFLADYIKRNGLYLSVPSLSLNGMQSDHLAVYDNTEYDRCPFRTEKGWQYGLYDSQGDVRTAKKRSTVARFLELVFHGAHMVAVSSSKDQNGGSNVSDIVADFSSSPLPQRKDIMSSHYGLAGVDSGLYFLDITGETFPADNNDTLIVAFLGGVTAHPVFHKESKRNCFIQLEGWPSQIELKPPGGKRHNMDYKANSATFWNFSTFGACAFSEKRSTTVFLANNKFDLTLGSVTHMPYYWGANAGNEGDSWIHKDLVRIVS